MILFDSRFVDSLRRDGVVLKPLSTQYLRRSLSRIDRRQIQFRHDETRAHRIDHKQPDLTAWPRPITIPGAIEMDGKCLKPRGQRNKPRGKCSNSRGN